MLQLIEHTQNHLDWRTAYMEQPLYIAATVSAQLVQNRECPYGTRTTPCACSNEALLACVGKRRVLDDPVLSSCCVSCCCCWWSSSSASLASNTTSNAAVRAPRLWLMSPRNCCMAYDPESYRCVGGRRWRLFDARSICPLQP